MPTIIYILIGFVVGYWVAGRFLKGKITTRQKEAAAAREKVMELFRKKDEITNNDVEHLLGVSDATATNYLSELERQDRITQVGNTGRGVKYIRRNG